MTRTTEADGVAVVTGGTSGIGFHVARQLAEAGTAVIITGQDQEQLTEVAGTLGVHGLPMSLNDPVSVERFFHKLGTPAVHIFLANAGSPERTPQGQEMQTKGALEVLEQACRLLQPGGTLAITNTSFTQYPDDQIPPDFKAYVQGKRALLKRAGELAAAHPSLRIIDVALGFVAGTNGLGRIMSSGQAEEYTRYMASVMPGGQLTTASEAAAFIVDQLDGSGQTQPTGGFRVGIDGSVASLPLPSAHADVIGY